MTFVAALPMYDWSEARAETDAQWAALRDALRAAGMDAPEHLVRRNADLPAVPGGISDQAGNVVAPDPATMPPDELDMHMLWRHPALLFGQTCWGPMELGLGEHVQVVGQPDYSTFEGGDGAFYSSAIVMRKGETRRQQPPGGGEAILPIEVMRGARLAFNGPDSMSGVIALTRDLEAAGENLDLFGGSVETGSHRGSVVAVAGGKADICAVDCRTWALVKRFEPMATDVEVVGWTARRKGLPYITSRHVPPEVVDGMRDALVRGGLAFPAL
ncbi:MAG: PhnD/SsuA/transferrin family substrate-binding protein [Rhizobiaceae bacterium]|nr:PhnD/SsuA/transferrin family substrate-binding protein [Rhizobiaceae bacterium]